MKNNQTIRKSKGQQVITTAALNKIIKQIYSVAVNCGFSSFKVWVIKDSVKLEDMAPYIGRHYVENEGSVLLILTTWKTASKEKVQELSREIEVDVDFGFTGSLTIEIGERLITAFIDQPKKEQLAFVLQQIEHGLHLGSAIADQYGIETEIIYDFDSGALDGLMELPNEDLKSVAVMRLSKRIRPTIGLFKQKKNWVFLFGIVTIPLVFLLFFAWSEGWINGGRLTSKQIYGKIGGDKSFPAGYRRAHGKGICFTGVFYSTGSAASLSKARVFTQSETPVIGRLSIGAGDPHAADETARVTSMSLLLKTDDNEQWRMAMNSVPFFQVSVPEGFYDRIQAYQVDPKTGKPDPKKVAAFAVKYPESVKYQKWAAEAPWPDSYSGTQFNGVNAFRFYNHKGKTSYVRWVMRPHAAMNALTKGERAVADPNYLNIDLLKRLKEGPLYWDLVLTVAGPKDRVNDPSAPWPTSRKQIIAGTLEVRAAHDQATGECRDINYDPTILPAGIGVSDDPVLAARSGVYSHSYNTRLREIGTGKATEAIGKK